MSKTFSEIEAIVRARQSSDSPLIKALVDMRNRYNGDAIFLPMPDVDTQPAMPNVSPHLIAEAIDTTAMRAASVLPIFDCLAVKGEKQRGVYSREYAHIRRRALGATFAASGFGVGRRRYYRHLAGYATCSLLVSPSPKGYPCVEIKDPLTTYPEPQPPEDLTPPMNVAYLTEMSAGRLRERYPRARIENGGPVSPEEKSQQESWTILEWIDADDWVIGIMGPVDGERARSWDQKRSDQCWLELSRHPNKAGMPVAIVPRRVTMDKIASQIANLVGQVDLMNRLIALDIIAQEKAIFPDRFILSREGEMPRIIGGAWKDGRDGETNLVDGAHQIGELRSTPDMRTGQLIDRMERNFRISSGLVPQSGGETYGALRTGRGIDALMGAAVDMRIQELHEISEGFLPHLCEAVFATYEGYWPNKKYSMVSRWKGSKGRVEFTPATHIAESHDVITYYPIAGADVSVTNIGLVQMRAAKGISQRSYRRLHPWIDDAEDEERWINEEDLEEAMKTAVMQQIIEGKMPPVAAAWLEEFVREGLDVFEAMKRLDDKMREMQAQEPPAPQPGQMMPPEMAPGAVPGAPAGPMPPQVPPMGGPGAGMSAEMAPGVTGPSPGQADIRRLLLAAKANPGIS